MHVLCRGLDGADLGEVETIAARVWCSHMTGTRPVAQRVEAIRSHDALVSYLAHHHRKREQAPPDWWRGMRTRASRGWWSRPIAELRQEAREQLRLERVRWIAERRVEAAVERGDLPAPVRSCEWDAMVAQEVQVMELDRAASPPWELWHLGADRDGIPRPWLPVPRE